MGAVGWGVAIGFWIATGMYGYGLLSSPLEDSAPVIFPLVFLFDLYWYLFLIPAGVFFWGLWHGAKEGHGMLASYIKWLTVAAAISVGIIILALVFRI